MLMSPATGRNSDFLSKRKNLENEERLESVFVR